MTDPEDHAAGLPHWMVMVARAPAGSARLLHRVGRPGVTLFDEERSRQAGRVTVDRFPRNRDASIDWTGVAGADTGQTVEGFLRAGRGDVLVIWGTRIGPVARVTATLLLDHLPALLIDGMPVFWLVRDGLLLECNGLEDTVTVIPSPSADLLSSGGFEGAAVVTAVPPPVGLPSSSE
ncbi:hypothetical protein [Actinoplanes rectilineatus]|uniref:hypothetical protein n=1 Tax=Actinoplanes rectilineatus TaxID=113571 RepID=UPI0005F2FB5A|nr:hypothetical protein [Actinoplanes rectilineatus]